MNEQISNEPILIIEDKGIIGILWALSFITIGLVLLIHFILNPQIEAPWFLPIFFIILGSLALLLPTKDSAIFNKKENTVVIRQKNLFWNHVDEFNLDQISQIKMLITPKTGVTGPSPLYRVICVLRDGREIFLSPSRSGFSASSGILGMTSKIHIPARETGSKIALFLGVPFSEEKRSSFRF